MAEESKADTTTDKEEASKQAAKAGAQGKTDDPDEMFGLYGITGEEFVLLATTIALSLAQGKTTKQVRFLSNLSYQISVSLGAISTQKANQRAGNLIV